MSPAILALLALLCPLAGTALGIALRNRLPAHHLSRDAIDVIKLAAGLMATLVALVLSLLISSANSYRVTVESGYRQLLAEVVQLDQYLQAYGAETQDIRAQVRRLMAGAVQKRWPDTSFGPREAAPDAGHEALVTLQRRIVLLTPNDAAQKWFQSQALQITHSMVSLRRLMSNEEAEGASRLPIFMLVFLSSLAIFGSFSLFVQPNPTVIAILTLAALSIAGATFVIAELNSPFTGLLQVPSTAARAALETLGK
ncbi:MAG: hypothetical protein U1E60_09625 [Reyranellaceae bacterium]